MHQEKTYKASKMAANTSMMRNVDITGAWEILHLLGTDGL